MIKTMKDMPAFIKRELENLEKNVEPLMKKASKYMFWSLPLISISIANLVILLFFIPDKNSVIASLIFFAVLGSIGFALSKEAKYHQKEMMNISIRYMENRISNSDVVAEETKREYITRIKTQPVKAISLFIEFLEKENRWNQLNS